jgi:carbon monoxide dehydrogenase subunit G
LAINFSGEFTTPRNPDQVYEFLSDPNKFGPLLPDFQSMSVQDPTHFTVKVRVGVGNIRGTAEIKMELAEATRPHRAQYKGQGTAVGSQITLSAGFDLSPAAESTKVAWQGEANVFGKLASMAGGMLEPLGRKNIQKLIDGLQKALAEHTVAPAVIPQNTSIEPPAATASAPMDPRVESPVETPGDGMANPDSPNHQASAPDQAEVEGLGFSPANSEPLQSEASAPEAPQPTSEVLVDKKP